MKPKASKREGSGPRAAIRLDRPSDAAPTITQGTRIPEGVEASWLDRLFTATLDLPLADGEGAVATALVDALAAILPTYAVGTCLVAGGASSRGQVVVTRMPEGHVAAPPGVDPTRLFPGLGHEHIVALASSPLGSTLHLASDTDAFDRSTSPAVHLLERAAGALDRSLAVAGQLVPARAPADFHERMVQADKLATFGQIAAGIVHELNNPLTSIVAYSDYLIRKSLAIADVADPDDVDRLRRISESANRMLRFTRDFVAYARPSTGAPGPVALHGVMDQAVAFCEHVLAAAGISVERRYAPDVLAVRGVGEQLVQVFVNLLTNASQAAPERGGAIVLVTTLDAPARRVTVCVEDNGAGITPEHLRQVFVPFFTTKGDRHGTGLGLSIVKNILDDHGGAIRVESQAGKGARFLIELPTWQRA